MCSSVRHVWVIEVSTTSKRPAKVLFTRKFPTVEKKARLCHGKSYTPVPPASSILLLLVQDLSQAYNPSKFIPSRDRCDLPFTKPVYRILTDQGTLWPIIVVEEAGLLLCCLPLVEESSLRLDKTSSPSVNILSVSLGFAFLKSIAEFLKVPSQELSSRLQELPAYINEAAPFGVLRDASVDNICARLANRPCSLSKSNKLPAWSSSSYRGKSSLHLCVCEYVSASQCAQETWQDSIEVSGSVTCRAEIESFTSDITLNISHQGDGLGIPLDMLIVHPNVQRADWHNWDTNGDSSLSPRRVRFSPPLEPFTLCHYTVKKLQEVPVFGVYHMKFEDAKVSITVQLKLNDQTRNSFEFCELRIPFYTWAPISNLEGTPTQGSLSLSSNKKEVKWNIGQKFTSKDQQALLAATVTFSSPEQGLPAPTVEDAFCRGNNSYAQLYFKILDFTHSGCGIDSKSIQVTPSSRFKLSISREYSAVNYKIWNSNGEALTTVPMHRL